MYLGWILESLFVIFKAETASMKLNSGQKELRRIPNRCGTCASKEPLTWKTPPGAMSFITSMDSSYKISVLKFLLDNDRYSFHWCTVKICEVNN